MIEKTENSEKGYVIIDSRFKERGYPRHSDVSGNPGYVIKEGTKDDCENWIIDGLVGTEGAERDHYVSLLIQIRNGNRELDYWKR